MNSKEEELIISYKKDFKEKTGKGLKCIVMSLRESNTNFIDEISFYKALDIILEQTKWDYSKIVSSAKSRSDLMLKRSIISYIMVNNGMSLVKIGFYMNRDHSSILYQIKTFEDILETDYYVQKLYKEIVNNLKENYLRSEITSKEQFEKKYLKIK